MWLVISNNQLQTQNIPLLTRQWFAEMCSCVIGFHKVSSSSNFTQQRYLCASCISCRGSLISVFPPTPLPPLKYWAAHEKDIKMMKRKCPSKNCVGISHRSNPEKPIPRLSENTQTLLAVIIIARTFRLDEPTLTCYFLLTSAKSHALHTDSPELSRARYWPKAS